MLPDSFFPCPDLECPNCGGYYLHKRILGLRCDLCGHIVPSKKKRRLFSLLLFGLIRTKRTR